MPMRINHYLFSEGYSALMANLVFDAFTDHPEIPGNFNVLLFEDKEGLASVYSTEEEIRRIAREGELFLDEKYRDKFISDSLKCKEVFDEFFKAYKKLHLKNLQNQKLLELFNTYCKLFIPVIGRFKVIGGRSYPLLEKRVEQETAKYFSGKELEMNYPLLFSSTKLDILQREEVALLKLAQKKNLTDDMLLAHSEKFALLYFNTYDEKSVVSFLNRRVSEARKNKAQFMHFLGKIAKEKGEVGKKQENVLKRLQDVKIRDLAIFLREQGAIRLELKDSWGGAEYRFRNLFKEIASRIGVDFEDYICSYAVKDTEVFLKSGVKLAANEMKKRRKLFIYFKQNGKKEYSSGRGAEGKAKLLRGSEKWFEAEVKGICGSPGKVVGKVKVVRAMGLDEVEADLAKFEEGDILVTPQTQPNMVLLMKKAGGIVTDEGGITCHAAVVSRELGVPCIVGTHKATRTFKNGDIVELDASKGVAKLIERQDDPR